jgi:hypothetical protein
VRLVTSAEPGRSCGFRLPTKPGSVADDGAWSYGRKFCLRRRHCDGPGFVLGSQCQQYRLGGLIPSTVRKASAPARQFQERNCVQRCSHSVTYSVESYSASGLNRLQSHNDMAY